MEHAGDELHHRGLVGVLLRELESELEGATLPWSVLRAEDHTVPVENIILIGSAANSGRRIVHKALEIAHKPLTCRSRHDASLPFSFFTVFRAKQNKTKKEDRQSLKINFNLEKRTC